MINKVQYEFLKRIDKESLNLDILYDEEIIYKDPTFHNLVLNLYTDEYFKIPQDFKWCHTSLVGNNSLNEGEQNRVWQLESVLQLDRNPYILTQKGIEAIQEYEDSLSSLEINKLALEYAKIANDHARQANNISVEANKNTFLSNIIQYIAIIIAFITLLLSILNVI